MEPSGRHALVTGGGRGIGAAIARALSAAVACSRAASAATDRLCASCAVGDVVAVCVDRSIEMVVAMLGVMVQPRP